MTLIAHFHVELFGEHSVFSRIRRRIDVEVDLEVGEVFRVFCMLTVHELFGSDAELACFHHHGSSVRVIRANEHAVVTAHLLETCPDVVLNVADQMPDMNRAIRVGQCAR